MCRTVFYKTESSLFTGFEDSCVLNLDCHLSCLVGVLHQVKTALSNHMGMMISLGIRLHLPEILRLASVWYKKKNTDWVIIKEQQVWSNLLHIKLT